MIVLPLTSDGSRRVTVNTGSGIYTFRTYFSVGVENRWMLDIQDTEGTDLLVGIPILPGSNNLTKGQGDLFSGIELTALLFAGGAGDSDALGSRLELLWTGPNEESIHPIYDPMVD